MSWLVAIPANARKFLSVCKLKSNTTDLPNNSLLSEFLQTKSDLYVYHICNAELNLELFQNSTCIDGAFYCYFYLEDNIHTSAFYIFFLFLIKKCVKCWCVDVYDFNCLNAYC